jgi:hypothetical protein
MFLRVLHAYITPVIKQLNFRHSGEGRNPVKRLDTATRKRVPRSGMTTLEMFTCRINSTGKIVSIVH